MLEALKETKSPTTNKEDGVIKLINQQISQEFKNATTYRHLSYECSRLGFHKAEKFFIKQSNDEVGHSDMLLEFIKDLNIPFTGYNIEPTSVRISTLKEAMNTALSLEQKTTEELVTIKHQADSMKTSMGELVYTFIIPMIVEQREEESLYKDYLASLQGIESKQGELVFENSYL
jgi:ferritin